jgi:hypothetical protein
VDTEASAATVAPQAFKTVVSVEGSAQSDCDSVLDVTKEVSLPEGRIPVGFLSTRFLSAKGIKQFDLAPFVRPVPGKPGSAEVQAKLTRESNSTVSKVNITFPLPTVVLRNECPPFKVEFECELMLASLTSPAGQTLLSK